MRIQLSILAIVVILFSISCHQQNPDEIVVEFITALNSSDYEKAKSLCDEDTKTYVDIQQNHMDAVDDTIAEQYSKAKIELVGKPKIIGDTMIYVYKASNIPSERKIMLIKKEKKWIVHNTYEEESLYAPIGEPIYSEEAIPVDGEAAVDSNAADF